MTRWRNRGWLAIGLGAWLVLDAQADSPLRVPMLFRTNWNVGASRIVFVVGNHADVGAWAPTGAVKLTWSAGNVWTGRVAVQAGAALEYKYIARTNSAAQYGNGDNAEWMTGDNLQAAVPAPPEAPYTGKTVLYHSRWTNAFILYKVGTNWVDAAMSRAGAGRGAGEYLYRVAGIGEEGEPLEFVPHGRTTNSVEEWDNAPYPGYGANNYCTPLDFIFLQDGDLFNYRPPAVVGAPGWVLTNVASSFPGIAGRTIRIFLPRGYTNNTWKRYPVLYLHDGQNVFFPGGDYGSWDCDLTATKEISQGRMRETILVGMDNTDARLTEYCPPGDNAGYGAGIGDQYANFVVHNVRPTLDTHFRTLNDPGNTLTLGSSMGGLISAYFGFETNVFGKVGVVSPSFWAADRFVGRINSNNVHGLRVYMDWGTNEDEGDSMWTPPWTVYDDLLRDGYAPNDDLKLVIGVGDEHNEAAWAARFPGMCHYLLTIRDEANRLAHEEVPPRLESAPALGQLGFEAQAGWTYSLERSASLVPPSWNGVATSAVEVLPWQPRTLTDPQPPEGAELFFYRLRAW